MKTIENINSSRRGGLAMRKAVLSLAVLALAASAGAQTPISPAYFGPNAFVVPEIDLNGTAADIRVEAGSSIYRTHGFRLREDFNADLYFRIAVPLFSDRVNLAIYGEVLDIYNSSAEANALRGLAGATRDVETGEIYVSTDFMLLQQKRHGVNLTLQSVLKSAAGGSAEKRRYYDSPGYHFNAVAERDFAISGNCALRLAATTGFLCWQTSVHSQNDAVIYGLAAGCRIGPLDVKIHWGGYAGWRKEHDCPMTLRAEALLRLRRFDIRCRYQEGLIDWPYRQFSVGLVTHYIL